MENSVAHAQHSRDAVWHEALEAERKHHRKSRAYHTTEGRSVAWELAVPDALKCRTTATNRWLADTLHMGDMYGVSRKVAAWVNSGVQG